MQQHFHCNNLIKSIHLDCMSFQTTCEVESSYSTGQTVMRLFCNARQRLEHGAHIHSQRKRRQRDAKSNRWRSLVESAH